MHRNLAFLPISEKIEWLKQHNSGHASAFCSPDQELSRQLYMAHHPTRIAAFKCMDGRINLPIVTSKPFGIIDPFRNLAGRFDFGRGFDWLHEPNLALLVGPFSPKRS
jgi:hypothetical protein